MMGITFGNVTVIRKINIVTFTFKGSGICYVKACTMEPLLTDTPNSGPTSILDLSTVVSHPFSK